jgi:hypothetical protein
MRRGRMPATTCSPEKWTAHCPIDSGWVLHRARLACCETISLRWGSTNSDCWLPDCLLNGKKPVCRDRALLTGSCSRYSMFRRTTWVLADDCSGTASQNTSIHQTRRFFRRGDCYTGSITRATTSAGKTKRYSWKATLTLYVWWNSGLKMWWLHLEPPSPTNRSLCSAATHATWSFCTTATRLV